MAATVSVLSASSHGSASNTPFATAACIPAILAAASLEDIIHRLSSSGSLHSLSCAFHSSTFLNKDQVNVEVGTAQHDIFLSITYMSAELVEVSHHRQIISNQTPNTCDSVHPSQLVMYLLASPDAMIHVVYYLSTCTRVPFLLSENARATLQAEEKFSQFALCKTQSSRRYQG